MKRGIIITLITLFILIATAGFVAAEDFEVSVEEINSVVDKGEPAKFEITIQNNLNTIEKFKIYTPGVEWIFTDQIVKVYPGKSTTFELEISPTDYILEGKVYGVKVNLRNEKTGELITKTLYVNVKSKSQLSSSYALAIDVDASIPKQIDPRDPYLISVLIDNLNPLNLSDMSIKFISDFDSFNTQKDFSINPLAKKTIDITYNLNSLESPDVYYIEVEILKDGKVVEKVPKKEVEIITITPPYKENIDKDESFLKTVADITYKSRSNVDDSQKVRVPTTTFKSWFTKVNPDAMIVKKDNQRYYEWTLKLSPGEEKTITMIRSYRILMYMLIALFVVFSIYAYYSSPVKIKKNITDVQMKEGGISEIKIMLEVKNLAKKAVKHVTITDYIPNIAEIDKHFVEGTLKPDKILKHKSKGTVLKWELDEIQSGEDRLLSYTLRSSLSITGDFKLPRAKVEFKHKKRKFSSYSNSTGASA